VRLDGSLEPEYWFCHGSSYEQRMHYNFDPTTLESLLFLNLPPSEQVLWTITPPSINPAIYVWDAIEVYSDSLYKNKIGDNKYTINVSPENSNVDYDSTYYVLIHRHDGQEIIHTVRVRIFKKPELVIYTNPANLQDKFKEYSLDDEITIGDESEGTAFESYKYYLNRKYINEHFYGGDTTRKEITLSAATFSGVEDFLEIIAVDTNKCVAKWSSEAIINIPFPTVFTPDGDGVNDIFFGGEKYRNREFHLEIFNRWGNRIYYGESGWDGSYRGKEAPPATYEYVIQIKMSDGTTKEVRGTVTLIRKGIK
jgi:gliding motility-associated-like protein